MCAACTHCPRAVCFLAKPLPTCKPSWGVEAKCKVLLFQFHLHAMLSVDKRGRTVVACTNKRCAGKERAQAPAHAVAVHYKPGKKKLQCRECGQDFPKPHRLAIFSHRPKGAGANQMVQTVGAMEQDMEVARHLGPRMAEAMELNRKSKNCKRSSGRKPDGRG